MKLAREAAKLIVAKGKKVVVLDLKKDKPSDADIAALIMGNSGNLRAPTLRVGDKMVVGFHADAYADLFG